ncbi:putative ribonuclease H protein At1g65750 family [Senna tora]|uniref:Putative ribonuclease H protein At1g65750 family n=1 Tax=Senna tora TaxID=362788 RepID=A0A834X0E3_9FABA|nr:putative ribonuclease H protein At1g65750 family [Senna tora]
MDLESKKNIMGVQFARQGPMINHLMYADDTILFFKADIENCEAINNALMTYSGLSGQCLYKDKPLIVFSQNMPKLVKKHISTSLGTIVSTRIGKYLGTHIDSKPLNLQVCTSMTEKMNRKLTGWKAKVLSQVSRLTLIKLTLHSINIYQLASTIIPKKYCLQMDSICSNFFWGFKGDKAAKHLLNKKRLFAPMDRGGMGLRHSELVNSAMVTKQIWQMIDNSSSLFSQWTISEQFKGFLENVPEKTTQPGRAWKPLVKSRNLLFDHLWWQVGSEDILRRSPSGIKVELILNFPILNFTLLLFVWPIFFTSLVFLYFTPLLFRAPELGFDYGLVFNYGFLLAAIYALFYVSMDYKSWLSNGFALFILLGWSQCSCSEAQVFSRVEGMDYRIAFN